MPYYRITLKYEDGSALRSIRLHSSYDIELVNRFIHEKIRTKYTGKKVIEIEVVMVSKHSAEVKAYVKAQGLK